MDLAAKLDRSRKRVKLVLESQFYHGGGMANGPAEVSLSTDEALIARGAPLRVREQEPGGGSLRACGKDCYIAFLGYFGRGGGGV